jgi:hypothetical protein
VRRWFVLVASCLARSAHAEPDDVVGRSLVLADRQLAAELTAEVNLAPQRFARPLSFAPDVWWGATSRWTLGVTHSGPSVDRFEPGASVCVRQDGFACDRAYRGGAVDVRWLAVGGRFAVAPRVRVMIRGFDPWKPAATFGALVGWTHGRLAITGDPYLQLGLANTERGNRAAVFVPLALAIQPTCRWAIELHTGWNAELAVAADGWRAPLYLGGRARATAHVDVAAGVGFTSVLGQQDTTKERLAYLTIGWRS